MYPGLQRQHVSEGLQQLRFIEAVRRQHLSEGGDGVEGDGDEDGDGCDTESHGNKVDRVCVAVRKALNKLGANKYLLSIITTYVKMTDPELETVLGMIKQLKGKSMHDIVYLLAVA